MFELQFMVNMSKDNKPNKNTIIKPQKLVRNSSDKCKF